jgi:hypothetical protein
VIPEKKSRRSLPNWISDNKSLSFHNLVAEVLATSEFYRDTLDKEAFLKTYGD